MSETILVTGGCGYIGSHTVVELLQKGFIKLVEDKIKTGNPVSGKKFPDIRPESYVDSDKLQEVIKINNKVAKKEKIPYVVQEDASTKPYIVKFIIDEAVNNYKKNGGALTGVVEQCILETIPLSPEKKIVLRNFPFIKEVQKVLSDNFKSVITRENLLGVLKDGEKITFEFPDHITADFLRSSLMGLKLFNKYLIELEKKHINVGNDMFSPTNIIPNIRLLIKLYEKGFNFKENKFVIDKKFLEEMVTMSKINLNLGFEFYNNFILGEYGTLFNNREYNILSLVVDEIFNSKLKFNKLTQNNIKEELKNLDNQIPSTETKSRTLFLLVSQEFLKFNIPINLISMFFVYNEKILDYSADNLSTNYAYDLGYYIKKKFNKADTAIDYFISKSKGSFGEQSYSHIINYLTFI